MNTASAGNSGTAERAAGAATMRLFFALWPDDATRAALRALQAMMHGRLTHYEDLHLTLAFLGQQPAALLPDLKDVLVHLQRRELDLTLDRVGYFPRNRVAWAGMSAVPPALQDLYDDLKRALAVRAIQWNGERAYTPHLTLARDATLPPDVVFAPHRWHATQVALVRSLTRAEGVRYEVLASRSLEEAVRIPDPDEDAVSG